MVGQTAKQYRASGRHSHHEFEKRAPSGAMQVTLITRTRRSKRRSQPTTARGIYERARRVGKDHRPTRVGSVRTAWSKARSAVLQKPGGRCPSLVSFAG